MEELVNINMVNGVNEKGEGFITVSAQGSKGTLLVGQMSPDALRQHGLGYLECAEAADQDAATYRVCQKLSLPDEMAALIVTELRESRENGLA